MGWLRYLFLGDLGQQLDIADQQAEIDRLKEQVASRPAKPSALGPRLAQLEREFDEMKLYLAVLVRLLLNKGVTTLDELKALVDLVDREDGVQDKKVKGGVLPKQ